MEPIKGVPMGANGGHMGAQRFQNWSPGVPKNERSRKGKRKITKSRKVGNLKITKVERYDVAVIVAAIHQMKLAGFHSRAMALVKEYAGGMLELAQFRMC